MIKKLGLILSMSYTLLCAETISEKVFNSCPEGWQAGCIAMVGPKEELPKPLHKRVKEYINKHNICITNPAYCQMLKIK